MVYGKVNSTQTTPIFADPPSLLEKIDRIKDGESQTTYGGVFGKIKNAYPNPQLNQPNEKPKEGTWTVLNI